MSAIFWNLNVFCSLSSRVQLLFWCRGFSGADVVSAGHKTSKVKVNASHTRPKTVGMLSSAICAFENAYRCFATRPDCWDTAPRRFWRVCSGFCHRLGNLTLPGTLSYFHAWSPPSGWDMGPTRFLQRKGWILGTIPFRTIIVWYLMNGPILEPSKRPKIEHLKKSK